MRNLLVCRELVQQALRNTDVHARFLECKDPLGRVDVVFQQGYTLQKPFHRFQFLENRFYGGHPFVQPFHECNSVLHKTDVKN